METSGITGLCHLDDGEGWHGTGWEQENRHWGRDCRAGRIDFHQTGKWVVVSRSFDEWGNGIVASYYFFLLVDLGTSRFRHWCTALGGRASARQEPLSVCPNA